MSHKGNFLQVVSTGQENQRYKIKKNISYDNIIRKFDSSFRLNFLEKHNIIYPEFLEITFSNDVCLTDYNEICKILHDVHLIIKVNNFYLLNIPLKFLLHFNKFEIYDNKFYLNLLFDIFIDQLLISKSLFELININDNIISCGLVIKNIYYLSTFNIKESFLQYLSSIQLNNINGIFEHKLPFNGIVKGLFLECINIDDINEIKLTLNDFTKHVYNKFFIKKNCIKISNKLLYYPFNSEKKYNDLTNNSFEGSINFEKINSVTLILNLNTNINQLTIYYLGSNIIKYKKNRCNLIYNYNFMNIHLSQNYGEPTIVPKTGETVICKLIINENKKTCNISLEDINCNSRYMNCVFCNNNFYEESLKSWLIIKKKCPLCRKKWLNYSIYINTNNIK